MGLYPANGIYIINLVYKGDIMRKRNDIIIMYYKCKYCSNDVTIPRQIGRKRNDGHVKDMWCPYCKNESKFIEIGQY